LDRCQIRVSVGPLYFFSFYPCEVILRPEEYCRIVNKLCRNFATKMQEAGLRGKISLLFLFCYVMFPRVRVCMGPRDNGFPYVITL
jgi:hypothetical protein